MWYDQIIDYDLRMGWTESSPANKSRDRLKSLEIFYLICLKCLTANEDQIARWHDYCSNLQTDSMIPYLFIPKMGF